MNKKAGLITDLFVWIAVVFIFSVSIIMVYHIIGVATDSMMDSAFLDSLSKDGVNATEIASYTIANLETGLDPLKWLSYAIIIGSIVALLAGNYAVRRNPLWVIPYIFVMIIAVIISVPVSNAYEEIMQNAMFGSTFQEFTGVAYIFLNLPLWVLLIGALGGIIMFVNILRDRNQPGEPF